MIKQKQDLQENEPDVSKTNRNPQVRFLRQLNKKWQKGTVLQRIPIIMNSLRRINNKLELQENYEKLYNIEPKRKQNTKNQRENRT